MTLAEAIAHRDRLEDELREALDRAIETGRDEDIEAADLIDAQWDDAQFAVDNLYN